MDEPAEKPRKPFTPWRENYRRAALLGASAVLALFAAAGSSAWTSTGHTLRLWVYTLSTLALLGGVQQFKRGLARSRGKRIERRAVASLKGALAADVDEFRTEVPVPPKFGGGDADAVVREGTRRWVVEVKSHRGVAIQRRLIGGAVLVRSLGAKPFKRNPFSQVLQHAAYFSAQPVVWFPQASSSAHAVIGGVLVVTGSARGVVGAAGMPRSKLFGVF
jgi:hypothetical protein